MTDDLPPDADADRAAEDLRSLPGWRRTGLVSGWAAVACATAALLLSRLVDGEAAALPAALLLLGCFATGLVSLGFLRRVWSIPAVADDRDVVRARRWADVAVLAWGAALLLRLLFEQLSDLGGTWLDVVRLVLAAVAVVAYVVMLVLATRWRPAPVDQL